MRSAVSWESEGREAADDGAWNTVCPEATMDADLRPRRAVICCTAGDPLAKARGSARRRGLLRLAGPLWRAQSMCGRDSRKPTSRSFERSRWLSSVLVTADSSPDRMARTMP